MYKMTGAHVVKPIFIFAFYMFYSRLNISNWYMVLAIATTHNLYLFNITAKILH